jgi:hypothetical protein
MKEPLVCAICLTKDRPEMLRRAVQSFREQTYSNARLAILDTSPQLARRYETEEWDIGYFCDPTEKADWSIGRLRNYVPSVLRSGPPDIFIHWDDDDWSHPNRISEQVAHLQASGADVVGYNEMLFWRRVQVPNVEPDLFENQAWLYRKSNARLETSFCYWRKTWERKPFPDGPKLGPRGYSGGEGYSWAQGLKMETVSGIHPVALIASIHGGNTMSYDIEGMIARGSDNWKRVPEWDAYCLERMKL